MAGYFAEEFDVAVEQPQDPLRVRGELRPLYGLQPGGFGLLDTSGQPLTAGTVTAEVGPPGRVARFTSDSVGYLRNLAVSASYPLSLVFRGVVNGTGFRIPAALATSADRFARIYCNGGPVAANHAGGTTSATATTGTVTDTGKPFTAVAVFGSATDLRIYAAGSAGRSSASSSTNIGTLVALDRLAYGQYNGGSVQYAWGGDTALAQWLNVSLTAAEAWALVDNPWQIFESPPIDIWVPSAGAPGGVTGSLATSETGADVAAFTGDVYVSGALSTNEAGADTAAFAGDIYITGTLAASETGSDTASFVGAGALPAVVGSFDILETGADIAAILGGVIIVGSLSATETGADTASITNIGSSLSAADLAAIADEVWAHPEAVGAHATLDSILAILQAG